MIVKEVCMAEEIKPEAKQVTEQNEESILFITEKDTFDVIIKYYKDKDSVMVEGIDDDFVVSKGDKSFTMTLKYPSQADVSRIAQEGIKLKITSEEMDLRDIMGLEFSRILCLMRKWSLKEKLNIETIMKLHPKIVKAVLLQVRIKLGMDGII